jgi:hypothetical protein
MSADLARPPMPKGSRPTHSVAKLSRFMNYKIQTIAFLIPVRMNNFGTSHVRVSDDLETKMFWEEYYAKIQ